jgi:hypothetical protein
LLLSQTHSIYYLQKTTTVSQDVSDLAHTLLAATIGHSSMSLNVSIAYNVLRSLDDDNFTVPRDCSSVYTGITPEFYDTANQKLPTIECGATLVGSNPSNFSALDKGKLLYACTKQFSFGRSGPHHETYGIPLLNEPAGPLYEFAFNATLPWTAKSRSFIGYRFGWALFAYVPCMLCLAFLSIDAMLVLLVETTIKYRNSGIVQTEVDPEGSTIFQKLQARLATYIRERDVRLTFGILLALNATVMMSLFVWLPWGVSSPRLGRPVCDEGQDADVDPHFAYLFYFKTKGGWQPDVSCLFLEVCVIAAQFFILVAIPLARKVSDVQPADSNAPEKVSRWVDVVRGARGGGFLIFATVVAIILLIAGNAWAGSIFGNAWARGVAEESVPWSDPSNMALLADYIYDMNMGTLLSTLAGGLVLGVVVGRWMFTSYTCESLVIFVVWILFAVGAFVPMIAVYGVNYFSDKNSHVSDCSIFPEGGNYELERSSCEGRYWTVISGIVLLSLVVAFISAAGLWEAVIGGACFKTRFRARVSAVSAEKPVSVSSTPQFYFSLNPSEITPRNRPSRRI